MDEPRKTFFFTVEEMKVIYELSNHTPLWTSPVRMGSGGSAAGNYVSYHKRIMLSRSKEQRKGRANGWTATCWPQNPLRFYTKEWPVNYPIGCSLKAHMPQESCSEIYICFCAFYHIPDHSFTNTLQESCWDWVTTMLISRFLCIWVDVTLQRIFELLLPSQVLFESLGPVQENESRKCLLSPLHSYAYTLKAVQKVPEVNSELRGNQPEKAVLWC